jgi:hypothetical protein
MNDLEGIPDIYFKKDNRPTAEKNLAMIEVLQKLRAKTREEIFPFLFRSKHTFAIVAPQNYKTIVDAIKGSHQNMFWYRDNSYQFIANQVIEYGFAYCQYSYSLPRPLTELYLLFMMVNYSDFFADLGYSTKYYSLEKSEFNKQEIIDKIKSIEAEWKVKYPNLNVKTEKIKFEDIVSFNQSFTTEVEYLNLDTK